MKIFFWTMVAVVAGIFLYSKVAGKRGAVFSGKTPDPRNLNKDKFGNTIFSGPDVDPFTGAYNPPDARPGTVEFPAQGN